MNRKYHYDILVSARVNIQLTGESMRLVCVQLKGWDFEKKLFNKRDGDFQQFLCKKQFQCTVQKISVWNFSFLKISFIFVLGFDFGSDSCVSKFGICVLCKIRFSIKSLSYEQLLFSFFNWTQTKLVLSPIRCALSWADTKTSY